MDIEFKDEEYTYDNTDIEEVIPIAWKSFFDDNIDILREISRELKKECQSNTIYPNITDVFRVFYMLKLEDIKVIILGMDPYHDGNAVGVAFSIPPMTSIINPSLRNIYTEVENCGYKPNKNGCLKYWVKQGVFLLNTALTVRKSCSESHLKIWSKFSKKLLSYLSNINKDIIYVLWGNKAQLYEQYISSYSLIIKSSHPMPLAFKATKTPFYNSKCFTKINEKLVSINKSIIKW